jgi:LacI family transcriptional regulator
MVRTPESRALLRRPTMREVAQRAGVSVSTVSRVMSDHPDVSSDTRDKVQTAVDELQYRRSVLARGLILNRTDSLGLLVSDITNPFYPQLAKGIEDRAAAEGWVLIMGNTERDGQRLDSYVDAMLERAVDGIIFGSVTAGDRSVPRLVEAGYPVVLVNRRHPEVETNMVIVDNIKGGRLATQHLLDLGHTSIAHIAGPDWAMNAVDRRRGYEEALAGAGIDQDPELITEGDFGVRGGAEAAKHLLSLDTAPTAMFATNDLMALGALEAIQELGLQCPRDVSVVGFDNVALAESKLIRLTTISHRIYEMGAKAVEVLLQLINEGEPDSPIQELLEPELLIRNTTAPPPPR